MAAAGHGRVVEMLKECPVGAEATLLIQRAGTGERQTCLFVCSVISLSSSDTVYDWRLNDRYIVLFDGLHIFLFVVMITCLQGLNVIYLLRIVKFQLFNTCDCS